MPVATVNGVRVHTQTLGAAGSRVVLVHGLIIGSIASWYFSIGPILARNHRVLMYDLRGHGRSEATPSGYGVRAMAADLDHLVRRNAGSGPVCIVGHSYGGVVALRFALDHPGRVSRLVIVEAPLPVTTAEHVASFADATHDSLVEMMPPWQRDAFATAGRRSQRLSARAWHLTHDTTMVDEMLAEPDIADTELAALRTPTLLCYGSKTLPHIAATRDRLALLLPAATVLTIDAGHYVTREAPERLAAAIGEFIDA